MNEIELFEKIEDAIHKGIYDELLDKTELKLKKLFSSYAVEDILALINRVIIFHNYNIDCKENDYSKYQRNKHMSLRILLSLPQYYYENISVHKNNHIKFGIRDSLIYLCSPESAHIGYLSHYICTLKRM